MKPIPTKSLGFTFLVIAILSSCQGDTSNGRILPRDESSRIIYAINSGSFESFKSSDNTIYEADIGFSGGNRAVKDVQIENTPDPAIYSAQRWGVFEYKLPVTRGLYNVTIKLAEISTDFQRLNARVFSIKAEGTDLSSNLDIYSVAGPNKALDITTENILVTDGYLNITTEVQAYAATIAGILVTSKDGAKGNLCEFNSCKEPIVAAKELRVNEGFDTPIGFYSPSPLLSWKLPENTKIKSQTAYHIVVASDPSLLPDNADLWDSKKVTSDQSVWIKYQGQELVSKQQVYWQVKYWDQDATASRWSEVAYFELGLLNNNDWQAKWINATGAPSGLYSNEGYNFHRPQYLRREFNVISEVAKARLYISSKGVFEAQINGQKIDQHVMTPGWTPYTKRIETLTYDVTELLEKDKNAIGIILAQGWYSGRIAYPTNYVGPTPIPQAIAQLEITYANGEQDTVVTDQNWVATQNGPIRSSDIYQGEDYDANFEMPGWSTSQFDASQWNHVEEAEVDPNVKLSPKRHTPVKAMQRRDTVSIHEPAPGVYIFDLGQNIVGVPELQIPVIKDKVVTVRFAELLNHDGTIHTENYRSARSTDSYIPKADGNIKWNPKFTFHGFRYVELSGFDESYQPEPEWIKGIVQHSDFEQAGHFTSSHPKLNTLQSNINWSLYGNFYDIPTDCPQRDERLGWTGDAQVFVSTSLLNADVHAFWASWLQSVREEQLEDGGIPYVVPNNAGMNSAPGWADAATIVPWEIYVKTGNKNILEENYFMMRKLVDYYKLDPALRIGELRSFGDWLQPNTINSADPRKGDTPAELIRLAYFARSTQITLQTAKILGYLDHAQELQALLDNLKSEFNNRFFDESGRLTIPIETQTAYLLALGFELVKPENAAATAANLAYTIEQADNHLRTGFLGTPLLAPTLQKYGYSDLMYEVLFQETYPSWFFSINQGATTLWERWNSFSLTEGFGDDNMNSFNHYAYGAIGQWFYEGIAGIRPLSEGYKKILISPTLGNQLTYSEASYQSTYGTIRSHWKKTDTGIEIDVTIPPNTNALITIPLKSNEIILVNGIKINEHDNIFMRNQTASEAILDALPGKYKLTTIKLSENPIYP